MIVPKESTEEELTREFERYGPVDSVPIVRDNNTRKPKGVAYVKYHRYTFEKKNVYEQPKLKYVNFQVLQCSFSVRKMSFEV